jgi:D-3-phosphoglycerate dehydrogenase / 2-oxoglutarate reductase
MANKPRVLVTHSQDRLDEYFGPRALDQLHGFAEVRLNETTQDPSGQQLVDLAQDCDVVIAYRQTAFDAQTIAAMPSVKALVRCAVDIRTIDVSAASANGILVTQASASFMPSVSEWVLAVMIDLARGISQSYLQYQAGKVPVPSMGRELRGSTLGLIGYGQISRHLAPIAQSLGMRVVVHDPYAPIMPTGPQAMPLALMLAASDFVVCLAKATPETENLMDAKRFAQMKPNSFFINASRGNLVNEIDLLEALNKGLLDGVAMDVGRDVDQTPSLVLAKHPRVLATRHIGGFTWPAIEQQSLETVQQTSAILQGRVPAGSVNAEYAKRLVVKLLDKG